MRAKLYLPIAAALLGSALQSIQAAPPANDDFAARIAMSSVPFSRVTGTNAEATLEPDEPDILGNGGSSVWWTWIAPADGIHEVNTFRSDFDTILYVFVGDPLVDVEPQVTAQSDNSSDQEQSRTQFTAVAGTAYQIAVHGKLGVTGAIELTIRPFTLAASNDAFVDRVVLPGVAISGAGADTTGATLEPGEPDPLAVADSSLWWSWTAPSTGAVQIDTVDSDFDTVLYVYTGNSVAALDLVGANDQADANTSRVRIAAVGGATYQIAVSRYIFSEATAGILSLNVTPGGSGPSNDQFSNRVNLGSSLNATTSGTNVGATTEVHEPLGAIAGDNSVWWTWTAPATGEFDINTTGSMFNTVLTLFSGNSLATLSEEAAGGAFPGSPDTQVLLNAMVGQTYVIRVCGLEGASGNIALQIQANFTPPSEPYAIWLANYPGLADTARLADPDRDGFSNLFELVFGLDPTVNSHGAGDPAASNAPVIMPSPDYLELRYTVVPGNLGSGPTAIQAMGEWSSTLFAPWQDVAPESVGGNQFRIRIPIDSVDRKFLRLRVTDPNDPPLFL